MTYESNYLDDPRNFIEREEKTRFCYECGCEIADNQERFSVKKWYGHDFGELCKSCHAEFVKQDEIEAEYELDREKEKQTVATPERLILTYQTNN
jgi:hypothetical protein